MRTRRRPPSSHSNVAREIRLAKSLYSDLSNRAREELRQLLGEYKLSIARGDITLVDGSWYVTHSGLLRIAQQHQCFGIQTAAVERFCDAAQRRWVFKAVVCKSATTAGFVGYGDANPSNVSANLQGAELRIAETRAVNRALRKAYGIGICSVDELGASANNADFRLKRMPAHPRNGNGNYGGPKVRDRLCQLIRQHRLDANLVKCYAVDFCGTKSLRDATREQVETFVAHLADWAQKDRNALLCQLNSYLHPQTETKEPGAA